MATKRLRLEEVNAELANIAKETQAILDRLGSDSAARKMQQGGLIIQARAQEILTEKGHILTGALRRSMNTRTYPEATGAGVNLVTEVGSFMEYAPYVEALPDGGYLAEAAEETFEQVTNFVGEQLVDPELRRWGQI